ncbi:unnamed protein product [Chrysodeixis includens]|uniref:Uncharacterized protein n=1 Tax=Chrysodeixis includens TaxID=689277 RepID=A0A9P0FQL3_CHRIL|nr:unnamed protein product [Chrysodeixis includens]
MSEIFEKSCYTARSSGYKYRTLSTNTGEQTRRDSRDDNAFEKKFRELRRAIVGRVNREVNDTHKARVSILQKFDKVDAKINAMLELQNTVQTLRKDLESAADDLINMVNKIDVLDVHTEMYSLQSQRPSFRSQAPIEEETEDRDSIVTHI